jgi:hypothetical protein
MTAGFHACRTDPGENRSRLAAVLANTGRAGPTGDEAADRAGGKAAVSLRGRVWPALSGYPVMEG